MRKQTMCVMAACCLVAFVVALPGLAAPPAPPADAPSVDVFQAMEDGEVETKLILQDAKKGTLLLENKTDRPLSIRLPNAFAGVPVLAQQGFGGGGGGQQGGMGGGGGMMGGGMMNVAPGKVRKVKIDFLCLEHGKPDPTPRVPYEMKPLESFTDKPDVIALCNMFGRGEIDQEAAQAAAWHLANDLSWQELAAKIGAKHLNGTVEPFFSRAALARGVRVANEAVRRSEGQQPVSPGEQQVTTP